MEKNEGEWEDGWSGYGDEVIICSECDNYLKRKKIIPTTCPNCGADMKKGNTNETA